MALTPDQEKDIRDLMEKVLLEKKTHEHIDKMQKRIDALEGRRPMFQAARERIHEKIKSNPETVSKWLIRGCGCLILCFFLLLCFGGIGGGAYWFFGVRTVQQSIKPAEQTPPPPEKSSDQFQTEQNLNRLKDLNKPTANKKEGK